MSAQNDLAVAGEPIHETTIRAHDLEFRVIMRPRAAEPPLWEFSADDFKTFCAVLEDYICDLEFEEVMRLHRGADGAFGIGYHDGSCDRVEYRARDGRLMIKSLMYLGKPPSDRRAADHSRP